MIPLLQRSVSHLLIVSLFFIFLYNPSMTFLSSGFMRYLLVILLLFHVRPRALAYWFAKVKQESAIERESVDHLPVVRYAIHGFLFFVSIMIWFQLVGRFIQDESMSWAYLVVGGLIQVLGLFWFHSSRWMIRLASFVSAMCRNLPLHSDSSRILRVVVAYLAFLTFYFLAVPVFMGTYDFSVCSNLAMITAILMPVSYLLLSCSDRAVGCDFKKLLYLISFATFLQSLFVLLEWFSPAFSDLTYGVINKKPMWLRASGLSSEAGDGLSMIQATGAMSSYYLYMFLEQRKKYIYFSLFMFVAQFLSIAFVGRTGFILLVSFMMISFLFGRITFQKGVRVLGFVALVGFIGYGLYRFAVPDAARELLETRLFPWAFESAYSFVERGTFETSSTTEIWEDMIFLPDSLKTLFIGNGIFVDPINPEYNYMDTDSGYIRFIFFSGLLGSFFFYLYFVLFLYLVTELTSDRRKLVFIFSFCVAIFVGQIKFPFLYLASVHGPLFLLLFTLLRESGEPEGGGRTGYPGTRCHQLPR